MAKMKQRSVFWIVSTHVLTTGFAMPAVAGGIGFAVLTAMQPSAVVAFLLLLAFQAVGYIGGVYYSLSYIRSVAFIENPNACIKPSPNACIKPSIITFAVLAVIGFAVNVAGLVGRDGQGINPILGIIALAAFYVVICVAFARITQRGFSGIEPHAKET